MKTVSFQEIKLITMMLMPSRKLKKLLSRLSSHVLEVHAPYQQHNIFKLG